MSFFDDLSLKVKSGAQVAYKYTSDLLDTAKIKYKIAEINSKISKNYEKIGKIAYERSVDIATDDEIASIENIFSEITHMKDEIAQLEITMSNLKND